MHSATSSGYSTDLTPNPPPTSGAMTRMLPSGRPSRPASMFRMMCGTWVPDQNVRWRDSRRQSATPARHSIGFPACRLVVSSRSTTRAAVGQTAPVSPAVKVRVSRMLSGASSCTGARGAPPAQADTVTGSGS